MFAFDELDRFDERIQLDVLLRWVQRSRMTVENVRYYMRFHPDRYMRNSLHMGPMYQALILCWRNGQRSPIHDHEGSNCVVKVLQGQALETTFSAGGNGMIYPTHTRPLDEGLITASQDRDIHQISNLQTGGKDLITLHIYSPPLYTMNVYSLHDASVRRFEDPINYDFHAGAGI